MRYAFHTPIHPPTPNPPTHPTPSPLLLHQPDLSPTAVRYLPEIGAEIEANIALLAPRPVDIQAPHSCSVDTQATKVRILHTTDSVPFALPPLKTAVFRSGKAGPRTRGSPRGRRRPASRGWTRGWPSRVAPPPTSHPSQRRVVLAEVRR